MLLPNPESFIYSLHRSSTIGLTRIVSDRGDGIDRHHLRDRKPHIKQGVALNKLDRGEPASRSSDPYQIRSNAMAGLRTNQTLRGGLDGPDESPWFTLNR